MVHGSVDTMETCMRANAQRAGPTVGEPAHGLKADSSQLTLPREATFLKRLLNIEISQ